MFVIFLFYIEGMLSKKSLPLSITGFYKDNKPPTSLNSSPSGLQEGSSEEQRKSKEQQQTDWKGKDGKGEAREGSARERAGERRNGGKKRRKRRNGGKKRRKRRSDKRKLVPKRRSPNRANSQCHVHQAHKLHKVPHWRWRWNWLMWNRVPPHHLHVILLEIQELDHLVMILDFNVRTTQKKHWKHLMKHRPWKS